MFRLKQSSISLFYFLLFLFNPFCSAILDVIGNNNDMNGGYSLPNNNIILNNNYKLADSCLHELRNQLNLERYASLVYKQMAFHFSGINVTRPGFSKLFHKQSEEELDHSNKFIDYINIRGEHIGLLNVSMPTKLSWSNALEAIEDSIKLEHVVLNEIYRMHRIAEKSCRDIHLMNFLESFFIDEQIESIHNFMKMSVLLKSNGAGNQPGGGYGEYLIDRDLYDEKISLDKL